MRTMIVANIGQKQIGHLHFFASISFLVILDKWSNLLVDLTWTVLAETNTLITIDNSEIAFIPWRTFIYEKYGFPTVPLFLPLIICFHIHIWYIGSTIHFCLFNLTIVWKHETLAFIVVYFNVRPSISMPLIWLSYYLVFLISLYRCKSTIRQMSKDRFNIFQNKKK